MKKTVYIHFGAPKTGSKLLQNILAASRDVLRQAGLFYDPEDADLGIYLNNAAPLLPDELTHWRNRFQTKYKAVAEPRILLSSENLCGQYPRAFENAKAIVADLDRIFEGFTLHGVAFVRRQDTFIESAYHQHIKQGAAFTFSEFLNDHCCAHRLYWDKTLDVFMPLFSNLTVHPYELLLMEPILFIKTFFDVLGLPVMVDSEQPRVINPSYNKKGLEIAQRCNPILDESERLLLRQFLLARFAKDPQASFDLFDEQQRCGLLLFYASSNRNLFQRYMPAYNPAWYLGEGELRVMYSPRMS